ncbi:hypothetical protein BEWA_045950 [Theileria equi strain WA]|uniref:Signal peptide containing protein n=1 Tax=Theileria equi strain WA TaxID=1537102 RepID=L1L9F9_THEEQ|nr:hypothetical protein BEWA_045950 [Theileria equi strain WA]EKX72131.1 hypothetical protein BEWA_045950 [Theileria equi strain WA]|eukprot:XP_004831583.1 hypothetical protein BEWA_045950 [Theileria equi strain WA]
MNILILLASIFIVKLCSCKRNGTAFPFDLSNPDGVHTNLTERAYSGITHEQYTVKEGFAISSVSDKDANLWRASKSSNEICRAVNLYSRGSDKLFLAIWIIDGRHLNIKRFERVEGKWESITLKEFNEKLNGVVVLEVPKVEEIKPQPVEEQPTEEPDSPEVEPTAEVIEEELPPKPAPLSERAKKVDAKLFDVNETEQYGIATLQCVLKEGAKGNQLIYDSETIWDGGEMSECLLADIYYDNKPELARLQIREGRFVRALFLCNVGGNWVDDRETFTTKFNHLKNYPKPAMYALNLATKIDDKLFDVKASASEVVPLLICTAKKDKNPKKLVYDKETIWSGGKKAHCSSALIYFYGREPRVVTLTIKDTSGNEEVSFLYKEGEKWFEGVEQHKAKLTELRNDLNLLKFRSYAFGTPVPDEFGDIKVANASDNLRGVSDRIIPESVTLDIAEKQESTGITVFEHLEKHGIKHKRFSPRSNVDIISVLANGAVVWIARGTEKCRTVRVIFNKDKVLVTLNIHENNKLVGYRSFEKVGNEWNEISEGKFWQLADEMKK